MEELDLEIRTQTGRDQFMSKRVDELTELTKEEK